MQKLAGVAWLAVGFNGFEAGLFQNGKGMQVGQPLSLSAIQVLIRQSLTLKKPKYSIDRSADVDL